VQREKSENGRRGGKGGKKRKKKGLLSPREIWTKGRRKNGVKG